MADSPKARWVSAHDLMNLQGEMESDHPIDPWRGYVPSHAQHGQGRGYAAGKKRNDENQEKL